MFGKYFCGSIVNRKFVTRVNTWNKKIDTHNENAEKDRKSRIQRDRASFYTEERVEKD